MFPEPQAAKLKPGTRLTLGQRIAAAAGNPPTSSNVHGEEFDRAIREARDGILQMTPLERMNRRYPGLRLCPLREDLRKLLGEPNVAVCLEYYRKFQHAITSDGDEEEIFRHVALGEDAICIRQEIVTVVERPQDIEDEEAMRFFGGEEGDADLSQG